MIDMFHHPSKNNIVFVLGYQVVNYPFSHESFSWANREVPGLDEFPQETTEGAKSSPDRLVQHLPSGVWWKLAVRGQGKSKCLQPSVAS